jgi:hypothetical protein
MLLNYISLTQLIMKKIGGLLIILLISLNSFGQNYKTQVDEHTGKVQKIDHIGLAIYLDLDKSIVKDAWKKELKGFGKVGIEKGTYILEAAHFPAATAGTCRILSQISTTGNGTRVWLSINTGDGKVKRDSKGYNGTKNFLEDFAKSMYRADIERQITEAQKAVENAQKAQKKLTSSAETLVVELQKNADEKIALEEAFGQNKLDQEQSLENVTQMEKALEVVTSKLDLVK